ncbi:hypothetical protein LF296_03925 [Acinetobacter vivianii]|uniref:Uncharacterized protein n=1 Tax=Acinetobacter vivianii TaxID=1776742 RepID=A0AAJ6P5Z7_9GAMM|nr:hypothetical protein [Acinetobacter vivianii]WDZ51940.1 hypothetical protein LF296_03925 [Acinetobacter vivianii]
MVTLDNKWLLENFLGNNGDPINYKYRPFYQGRVYQKDDLHIIDFKNCRFFLPLDAIEEIAKAADILTQYYLAAFANIEKLWSAQYFPFLSKYHSEMEIAICTIDLEVWYQIQTFIHAHDIDKGKSDWHIFYAHRSYIQVYSPRKIKDLNIGFHGTFFAKDIDNINFQNEITLVWQKPYNSNDIISDKDWWSCEKAYRWITEELIPKATTWQGTNEQSKPFFNIFKKYSTDPSIKYWNKSPRFRDIRKRDLLAYNHFRELNLVEIITELQSFYSSNESNRAYFKTDDISNLYQSLIYLIKQERGHFSYIKSKLVFDDTDCKNITELIDYLNKKISSKNFLMTTGEIELIFRGMLEAIYDDENWISHNLRETVFLALHPFMKFYDHANTIERYSNF